jgi:hypothetical protein
MYIAILYGFFGILIVQTTDKYILNPLFPKNQDLYQYQLISQVTIIIGMLAIISYLGRNFIEMIPFPLDGIAGFDYMRVKEVVSGGILTMILIGYSSILINKTTELKKQLFVI